MEKNSIETFIGSFILIFSLFFIGYAYKLRGGISSHAQKYIMYQAKFGNIEGIFEGSEVKIGGVKVGETVSIKLNRQNFLVFVEIKVLQDIAIPEDSILMVSSSGIFGRKFLEIRPGGSENFLGNGDMFYSTQSSLNLEGLINKFASGGGSVQN